MKFIRRELLHELFAKWLVVLYKVGAFTIIALWSTYAWTEKFNNWLCTHFFAIAWSEKFTQQFAPNKSQVWMDPKAHLS